MLISTSVLSGVCNKERQLWGCVTVVFFLKNKAGDSICVLQSFNIALP